MIRRAGFAPRVLPTADLRSAVPAAYEALP